MGALLSAGVVGAQGRVLFDIALAECAFQYFPPQVFHRPRILIDRPSREPTIFLRRKSIVSGFQSFLLPTKMI